MADLAEILIKAGIGRALIVDDAFDPVPLADDLSIDAEQWRLFFDDLTNIEKVLLAEIFPGYSDMDAQTLQESNEFVATLWANKDTVAPERCRDLFTRYGVDMAEDRVHLNTLTRLLDAAGLTCVSRGKDFIGAVADADIIFMDLYLCSAQRPEDINVSIEGLAHAISERRTNPPLVILMSRSNRLADKRAEFREKTKLFESTFRILKKSDIPVAGVVERTVGQLATHYQNSLTLSRFVCAWEDGLDAARLRTAKLIRNLGLSDLAQIQHLLLSAEGEPMGSYLVDVLDKVLQHEIEANPAIIDAAVTLNNLDTSKFPAPFIPGANDLLKFVEHTLFHHRARLRLPGAIDSCVSFGDVLRRKQRPVAGMAAGAVAAAEPRPEERRLPDVDIDKVLVVLSPACDLQRKQLHRVLLLVGELVVLKPEAWNARVDGAKTPILELSDGIRRAIRWNLKNFLTLTHQELNELLVSNASTFEKVARLRDLHALEVQQKLLASMGRIGIAAPMPATRAVRIEAFTVNPEKTLRQLDVPSLVDGGVCFIGRSFDGGKTVEKLLITEEACEGICRAIDQITAQTVHEFTREKLAEIQKSNALLETLEQGVTVPSLGSQSFVQVKSSEGITQFLVGRNRKGCGFRAPWRRSQTCGLRVTCLRKL